MKTLDDIVSGSLRVFLAFINDQQWYGRENEAVSLYAFGFLQKECTEKGLLYDPTQIGIEVGAADTPKSQNSQVRKDLVIWRIPGANRWYPANPRSEPLAIMEWKVWRPEMSRRPSCRYDIAWLSQHCRSHPKTVGYAVLLDLTEHSRELTLVRIDAEGSRRLDI
jgi:hypothetical protein